MKVKVQGNLVTFSNPLNEEVVPDDILAALKSANNGKDRVRIDLSGSESCNSLGVRLWLLTLQKANVPITYVNCPTWLVYQFNMISSFFDGDVDVESIQAVFYRETDDSTRIKTLKVHTDIPILETYEDFEIPMTSGEDGGFEADFEPTVYFDFLSKFAEKKRSA